MQELYKQIDVGTSLIGAGRGPFNAPNLIASLGIDIRSNWVSAPCPIPGEGTAVLTPETNRPFAGRQLRSIGGHPRCCQIDPGSNDCGQLLAVTGEYRSRAEHLRPAFHREQRRFH